MPPHRNVPSNTPSIKPVKPERTLRSHEENQERAYIAASRRSDRSLEARVESARRASDIHKKRTGRALRVTEQDVMNEEMYEEEDDDIPWRYRSVTSHLPLEDGLLSRRLQSMLSVQLEHQRLLGQAVNSTLEHNPQFRNQDFRNQAQFVSPNMMQMPQFNQNSMMPPQQLNRSPTSSRHSPYPMQQAQQQQQMKPQYHQRSASIATPQEWSSHYQYNQSGRTTPAPAATGDERRMSVPQNPVQQAQRSSSYSSHPSAPATPAFQQPSAVSPEQQTQQSASPYQTMSHAIGPFTTNLPMDTQQLLAGSDNYPAFDLFGPSNDFPMKVPQQPFYSYKPNASSGNSKTLPNTSVGLDQTLGTALDTNLTCDTNSGPYDTPNSASTGPLNSAFTEPGYGFGFDGTMGSMFGMDPFGGASGGNSGHVTPGIPGYNEPLFNDFLEQDIYGDIHAGPA
ncbi:uncharacterized protein LTR77_003136 [Saxophila tyrrhenica]|uniref:Uncharacterized protein n=1 Tax=Saxophila tyrrhenica TaxID=1690608 RepID=A0AAV9PJC0_9PEZI|nr:hypothetical protein LTR77_003136 [Saxophila tyrrhenica]